MLGHVGEDVVKHHIAEKVAVVDADLRQWLDRWLDPAGFFHLSVHVVDVVLGLELCVSILCFWVIAAP
jgi:hypothetical protein